MKQNKTPDYIFVSIQLLLFVLYWWHPEPVSSVLTFIWKYIGVVLGLMGLILITFAFIQLNRNLTMLPTPVKNATLITTGVFKYIRHPIYSGIFLVALGYAMIILSFDHIMIALLILLLFEIKSNYEEKKLTAYFPDYIQYKSVTGKFFPFHLIKI